MNRLKIGNSECARLSGHCLKILSHTQKLASSYLFNFEKVRGEMQKGRAKHITEQKGGLSFSYRLVRRGCRGNNELHQTFFFLQNPFSNIFFFFCALHVNV